MCDILNKLEELTPHLPPTPFLADYKSGNGSTVNYSFENGSVVSETVYAVDEIGISKSFVPKGVKIDIHEHPFSAEWLIILEGVLMVYVGSKEEKLHKYDSIKIDTKQPHYAIAVEDSTVIAITVPKDDGYPD
jgi:quercetin dioxygenase-like cupin family protein